MRVFVPVIGTLVFLRVVLGLGLSPGQITDFVTFGDSYTDVVTRGDGPESLAWPTYVERLTGAKLHPFAKSGATCAVNITFQSASIFEYQLPEYFKWIKAANGSTVDLDPLRTVYTLWIGTNDVGRNSLLTGKSKASIVDVVNCSVSWVKTLYDSGARNFIFQNMIPLQLAPTYYGDIFMKELVLSGNEIAKLMLKDLARGLDCAHIGLFDSYGLFWDMFYQPKLYLNGTVAPNVRGVISGNNNARGAARDSYLWYNSGHPSEQADRIVAREIGAAIAGNDTQWITWFS
ncbi:hypothetical protein ONZ45_g6636 [Pleurotus djamor]|nr:hypothetical protein ONZ45_g6636 [Pleurotus djamor]